VGGLLEFGNIIARGHQAKHERRAIVEMTLNRPAGFKPEDIAARKVTSVTICYVIDRESQYERRLPRDV
jgi:hypothetical protein